MCAPISAIILKDDILFSNNTHSHTEILKECGIEDSRKNAETLFVRAELSPVDGDMFSDIAKWRFRVDQDIRPGWFVKDYEKERMINKSVCYAADHIHIGKDGLELTSGVHWIKNCVDVILSGNVRVVTMQGSTVQDMRGNSTVQYMRENSTVQYMRENSTVQDMRENSTVQHMWENSTVQYMWGNSTVQHMRENSTVQDMRENSTVQRMRGNSTVQDMWGNSTVQDMRENSTVQYMRENSTVQDMRENSTVQDMRGNSTVQYMWGNSTVQDMRGNSTVQHMRENSTAVISKGSKIDQGKIALSGNATIKDFRINTIYHCGNWKATEVKQ